MYTTLSTEKGREANLKAVVVQIRTGERRVPSENHRTTTSLHTKAYKTLREAILKGEYSPNQRLIEADLARSLGVSRTPLREALRLLENEGIVLHSRHRGWVVVSITADDIRQIFEIKFLLESYASGRAAELATDEERKELLDIVDRLADAEQRRDTRAWLKYDREYHDLIFACTRNERLKQTLHGLNDQWFRLRIGILGMTRRMEDSLDEHRKIAELIAAGDGDAAAEVTREHLTRVLGSVEAVLNSLLVLRGEGV